MSVNRLPAGVRPVNRRLLVGVCAASLGRRQDDQNWPENYDCCKTSSKSLRDCAHAAGFRCRCNIREEVNQLVNDLQGENWYESFGLEQTGDREDENRRPEGRDEKAQSIGVFNGALKSADRFVAAVAEHGK